MKAVRVCERERADLVVSGSVRNWSILSCELVLDTVHLHILFIDGPKQHTVCLSNIHTHIQPYVDNL